MGKNMNSYSPNGAYSRRFEREADKFDGLLSKKQQADLEGGGETLKVERVSRRESDALIKKQRSTGVNFHDPFGFECNK